VITFLLLVDPFGVDFAGITEQVTEICFVSCFTCYFCSGSRKLAESHPYQRMEAFFVGYAYNLHRIMLEIYER